MKKSTLLMVLSLVLALALGVGGTMAYLQDTDEDVNVMTLGNVHIKQIEKERIEQTNDSDAALQDFTQGKPLYPAVGDIAWAEGENGRIYQEWPTGGSSALFDTDKLNNELDKFVFVENTGKSDAYIRTVFAFELAEGWTVEDVKGDKKIHLNINDANGQGGGHYVWDWVEEPVAIDGRQFAVATATYVGKDETHKGGILPAGETSRPSLLQVFMDKTATNEDIESLGETYDILVVSQAVQTMGFEDKNANGTAVDDALNEAFGEISATSHPWMDLDGKTDEEGDQDPDGVTIPILVSTADELKEALKVENATVVLNNEIVLTKGIAIADGVTVNLNGYSIVDASTEGRTFAAQNGSSVTIEGKGEVRKDDTVSSKYAMPFYVSKGTLVVDGGTYNMGKPSDMDYNVLLQNTSKMVINDGIFTNTANYPLFNVIYSSTLEINGGYFESIGATNPDLLDLEYHASRISSITIKGGTFVNYNPLEDNEGLKLEVDSNGQYESRVIVADGYKVVSETKENGDVWYTVVKE